MRWSSRSGPRLRPVQYEAQGPDRGMPRTHEGHNNRPQLELPAMGSQIPPIGQRRAFSLVGRPVEVRGRGASRLSAFPCCSLEGRDSRLDHDARCRH